MPTHFFKLYYQDSCIQFYLPLNSNDDILERGESINIPRCPPLTSMDIWPNGIAKYDVLDLSSTTKRIGELSRFNINFDEAELARTLAMDLNENKINGSKFDPSDIITIFFSRETSE